MNNETWKKTIYFPQARWKPKRILPEKVRKLQQKGICDKTLHNVIYKKALITSFQFFKVKVNKFST